MNAVDRCVPTALKRLSKTTCNAFYDFASLLSEALLRLLGACSLVNPPVSYRLGRGTATGKRDSNREIKELNPHLHCMVSVLSHFFDGLHSLLKTIYPMDLFS